jgi:large subunit ribosomal protein L21
MYAVIKTGGKQYRVQAGDVLVVEKLDGEAGAAVAFNEVLMVGEGADVTVGAPLVEGAVVNATLIETRKGDKVRIFKKIRRQGYRRTKGHRQLESVLRVTSVAAGKGKEDKWDGKVDLTTKAVLDARARNLKSVAPRPRRRRKPRRLPKRPKPRLPRRRRPRLRRPKPNPRPRPRRRRPRPRPKTPNKRRSRS